MANEVTSSTATNVDPTAAITQQMQDLQLQKMKFDLVNQQISAAMTASSSATNLITSAHQAAGNAAKAIGQNMVDSSRR